MGYFIVGVLTVVFLAVLVSGLAGMNKRKIRGVLQTEEHRPVSREKPAADEPTPAASVVASRGQREEAAKRTPPA